LDIETESMSGQNWLSAMATRPFDLSAEVPVRIGLLAKRSGDRLLAIVMHHIISDHISFTNAIEDLSEIMTARNAQREPDLADLRVQFPDYAAWYNDQERAGAFDGEFRYWQRCLVGALEATILPIRRSASPEAATEVCPIPVSVAQLAAAARQLRTTPYIVALAMFSQALGELTGASDQVISTATANRPTPALRRGVGRFVNLTILRLQIPKTASLTRAVALAHEVAAGAFVNAVVPLDAVLERGLLGVPTSPIPYANIAFQLLDEVPESLAIPGLAVRQVPMGGSTIRRDLNVTVARASGQLALHLSYRPASIDPDWISALAGAFTDRLRRLVGTLGEAA
jgi:hypothetical protein